jgi:hypothetical protein
VSFHWSGQEMNGCRFKKADRLQVQLRMSWIGAVDRAKMKVQVVIEIG